MNTTPSVGGVEKYSMPSRHVRRLTLLQATSALTGWLGLRKAAAQVDEAATMMMNSSMLTSVQGA